MIRIVLKHDDKVTTDDLVDFRMKIKKQENMYEVYGYNTLEVWKEKYIQVDDLEKIILYYKDGYKELISKADFEELLSDITGQESSICFKYKNKS